MFRSAAIAAVIAAAAVLTGLSAGGCFQSQEVPIAPPAAARDAAAETSIGGPGAVSVGRVDAKVVAPALGGGAAPVEQHGTGHTSTTTVTTSDWWSTLLATLESCWTQLLSFLGLLWVGRCMGRIGDKVEALPLQLLQAGLVVTVRPPDGTAVPARPTPSPNGSPVRSLAAAFVFCLGLLVGPGCSTPGVELVGLDAHSDQLRHGRGRHLRYESRPDGTVVLEDTRAEDLVNEGAGAGLRGGWRPAKP